MCTVLVLYVVWRYIFHPHLSHRHENIDRNNKVINDGFFPQTAPSSQKAHMHTHNYRLHNSWVVDNAAQEVEMGIKERRDERDRAVR